MILATIILRTSGPPHGVELPSIIILPDVGRCLVCCRQCYASRTRLFGHLRDASPDFCEQGVGLHDEREEMLQRKHTEHFVFGREAKRVEWRGGGEGRGGGQLLIVTGLSGRYLNANCMNSSLRLHVNKLKNCPSAPTISNNRQWLIRYTIVRRLCSV